MCASDIVVEETGDIESGVLDDLSMGFGFFLGHEFDFDRTGNWNDE